MVAPITVIGSLSFWCGASRRGVTVAAPPLPPAAATATAATGSRILPPPCDVVVPEGCIIPFFCVGSILLRIVVNSVAGFRVLRFVLSTASAAAVAALVADPVAGGGPATLLCSPSAAISAALRRFGGVCVCWWRLSAALPVGRPPLTRRLCKGRQIDGSLLVSPAQA